MMPLVNDKVLLANEMSGSVGGMIYGADTDMGDANVDDAVPEQDAFDIHCSNAGDLVSLKMLFCIKQLRQNLAFCPTCHHFAG